MFCLCFFFRLLYFSILFSFSQDCVRRFFIFIVIFVLFFIKTANDFAKNFSIWAILELFPTLPRAKLILKKAETFLFFPLKNFDIQKKMWYSNIAFNARRSTQVAQGAPLLRE